jgi:hypothetical protein
MAFERHITGSKAVIDVLRAMGLPAPSSVADSQDSTALQMWQLASDAGRQLLTEHDWQVLSREMVITTVPGQSEYQLPDDLARFVPDSSWNRTTRLPAYGSLREQEWQALKARNLGGTTFTMLFTIADDKIQFYESPSTVQEIYLPYVSRGWVTNSARTDRQDYLAQNSDIILYEPEMFKCRLRRDWLRAKGLDSNAADMDYQRLLESAKGTDVPMRSISIGGFSGYPYLGILNIPDTGYGR